MTPVPVIIRQLRQQGVRVSSYGQLYRICVARWAADRANAKTPESQKNNFEGMEDWEQEHRVEITESNDS